MINDPYQSVIAFWGRGSQQNPKYCFIQYKINFLCFLEPPMPTPTPTPKGMPFIYRERDLLTVFGYIL